MKILGVVIVVASIAGAGYLYSESRNNENAAPRPSVDVVRETIVDKVLAIGTIEPEHEISVKSKVSGVVNKIFAVEGDYVRAGEALLEVKPDPTPLELAEAKQAIEIQEITLNNMKRELERRRTLADGEMISRSNFEDYSRQYDQVRLQLQSAQERLALLESGRVTIKGTEIESIIRAPIDGFLLTKSIEVGDPVTPLTSYQEGTVLLQIADMKKLLFKGTVDETDVGKLREGMPVELKIGALPDARVDGILERIWLKSEKKDNSTVFPVEISIGELNNIILRAGYSANANIIIQKRENVLIVPERVVTFRNDSSFVNLPLPEDKSEEKLISTGLSDAINVEVVSGLSEGDKVLEKPVREIQ